MQSRTRRNYGITHSLTPVLIESPPRPPPQAYEAPLPQYNPLYTRNSFVNPLTQRSRKHRLLEQKNTSIEVENRRLYEKLRKIKLKNAFQSETKLEAIAPIPEETFFGHSTSKPLSLPQVPLYPNPNQHGHSLNSTKSQLSSILNDRKTFVSKYFEELGSLRKRGVGKTEELGNFLCNGWKVRALLLDDEFIILRGRQGIKELTKKYKWQRVKNKMQGGLQNWVKFKFQFED